MGNAPVIDMISMDWLFGKVPTVDDKIQEMRSKLRETREGVDLQIDEMKSEKRRAEFRIKRESQKDRPDREEMKTLALRFVKYKNQIRRLDMLVNKIMQFDVTLNEVRINHQMSQSFVGLAACIDRINATMNPAQLSAIIMQYEESMRKMDVNQDEINDQLDDMAGNAEDDEADADDILEQVFTELDIEMQAEVFIDCHCYTTPPPPPPPLIQSDATGTTDRTETESHRQGQGEERGDRHIESPL